MKKDIHPQYFPKATIKCACGAVFEVGSTKEFLETEICSECHPFYTGKEKIVDTLGRVEKFKAKVAKKEEMSQNRKKKEKEKKAKTEVKEKTTQKKQVPKKDGDK